MEQVLMSQERERDIPNRLQECWAHSLGSSLLILLKWGRGTRVLLVVDFAISWALPKGKETLHFHVRMWDTILD
jgi:hypothetical protein